ncbi:MAG: DEAD/DEAH box helicase, partial [Akkermansiaceae bacterium]|nr:DEAD/DEAH box helicase [Akkermansiaceae bacterium]
GQWTLSDQSAIPDFLAHTLPHLQHPWQISESARLARTRSQLQIVQPKLQILGSGEDWLSFNLSFESTDGATLSHAEVQRLLRSGKPKKGNSQNTGSIVSSDVSNIVGPLFEELDLRQEGGHFQAGKLAAAVIRVLHNNLDNSLSSNSLPILPSLDKAPTMRVDYRPYQATGIDWLADRMSHYQGALLADDMGLGKTIQTIALIEHLLLARNPDDPGLVLVVATASLLGNWAAEIARFAPGRPVHTLHGANRDALRDRIEPGGVILTSYSTLPRDLAWHLRQNYLLVVADEASLMRNPDTDHAKALFKLRADHRLALSGTPLENGVRDLWSIFHFILPGWLGNRASFRDRYELPLAANPPDAATLERLRLKTSPFLLRRTKTQVATDLPAKLVINEFCDLSSQQLATYQQLIREGRQRVESIDSTGNPGAARIQLLTTLLRLRQTCCDLALLGNDRFERASVPQRSSKLERLLELLEEAFSSGHKVLVFSQFRTQLLEIEKQTSARGWASVRLDGQSRNRQQLVDQFQAADGPPLFLISLKAGGYGLNLTAADTVIHFDPWWNPAAEAQATDRAHRIGQTRPVTIYRLLTRNTVEEKVLRLQARKRQLASLIDESGQADAPALTLAELQSILD